MSETPSEAARRHLAALAALPSTFPHDQKICDARDWSDPRIAYVIRHALRCAPFFIGRQWEYAQAFSILARRGALRPDSVGISFGAGRELLTYAVANAAGKLVATDLYDPQSIWDTARSSDPSGHVLANPPFPVEPGHLEARSMDMRAIDAPDGAFDFAYSISTIEHIGTDPDFVRHFAEVRRVLKPGGVYAMTTELCLGPRSNATAGNYAFAIAHLLDLCRQGGLAPDADFDGTQSDAALNWPTTPPSVFHRDPLYPVELLKLCNTPVLVREYGGIVSVPCSLVLRPAGTSDDGACRIAGLNETVERARRHAALVSETRFRDWTQLSPAGLFIDGRYPYAADEDGAAGRKPAGDLMFSTAYNAFGGRRVKARVTLVVGGGPPRTLPARVDLMVHEWSHADLAKIVPVVARPHYLTRAGDRLIADEFEFASRPDHCYAIFGWRGAGDLRVDHADVAVRFAD